VYIFVICKRERKNIFPVLWSYSSQITINFLIHSFIHLIIHIYIHSFIPWMLPARYKKSIVSTCWKQMRFSHLFFVF